MESVPTSGGSSREDGVGTGTVTEGLTGALRIDTEQVRNHVDEVVRSTVLVLTPKPGPA